MSYEITVTLHAHQQYCSRVEAIGYTELNALVNEQYRTNQFQANRQQFIHLAGVWWVVDRATMTFITCYGKTEFNVPKALAWAARHNDRLRLR